jgi:nucleoside-diphosphate-sugar epimerase
MKTSGLTGKRVLVIGATGFVGCRLVERLVRNQGAAVTALVRNFSSASRIGRFPIQMVHGDVLDPGGLRDIMAEADVVIHCAYGTAGDASLQKRVTVSGTKNVLQASLEARVERIVYLSSLAVYGVPADGDLTEESPRRPAGTLYADSKLEAERLALQFIQRHRAPISILQPSIIYGPYGPLWTVGVLRSLASTGQILVDGGKGLCNAVYVDDVVSAILLAATHPAAIGETFLVSASEPVTWREYYEGYEQMLGMHARTMSVTSQDAIKIHRLQQKELRLGRVVRHVLGEDQELRERIVSTPQMTRLLRTVRSAVPAGVWKRMKEFAISGEYKNPVPVRRATTRPLTPPALHPIDVRLQRARVAVRIDKAVRLLGYRPDFDLQAGLAVTNEWAHWANLIPKPQPLNID